MTAIRWDYAGWCDQCGESVQGELVILIDDKPVHIECEEARWQQPDMEHES